MKKHSVLITQKIPEVGVKMLRDICDLVVYKGIKPISRKELCELAAGKDGILCMLTDPLDSEVIRSLPQIRIISNMAVGYDNIDVQAATENGTLVTNTPGVLTETTADLAWALIMAAARRIPSADRFFREGAFHGWMPTLFLGNDIYGKTLGVIGMGKIGGAVARRAVGFNMKVIYNDARSGPGVKAPEGNFRACPLDELLSTADFISIHVPLTPQTRHLIDRREFGLMKREAILVNTARGPVINEEALAEALKTGEIAGAGLDVYENEPEAHPDLFGLDNVVLLPHIGSAGRETRERMARMAAENLIAGLENRRPPNLVNPEASGIRC